MGSAGKAPAPMVVRVVGRVQAVRRFAGKSVARIVCPAVDAYSHPATVEVRSVQRLADVGADVSVECRLSGFQRKPFRVTDKETGEVVTVVPVDHVLDVIE